MASRFKSITQNDIKIEKSRLNQLIDIIAADISDENNRRKYPSFVTGLVTPVTSSLFQTIYDQDVEYQSSNAILDMSFGVYTNISGSTITGSTLVTSLSPTIDTNGKLVFETSTSTMMREKINVYRQYAQLLLGDANSSFFVPFESTSTDNRINEALFINIKRLFKRDNIYKGSFGIKLNTNLIAFDSSTVPDLAFSESSSAWKKSNTGNLFYSNPASNQIMIIDKDGSSNFRIGPSGEVGVLYSTADLGITNTPCGLIFYDVGVVVLSIQKLFSFDAADGEKVTGIIDFPDSQADTGITFKSGGTSHNIPAGKKAISKLSATSQYLSDFLKLATLDNIIDHFCMSRFSTTTTTAIAFQNETIINSTIYYCNASPDEFNYSTNPSYTDSNGKIQVVEDDIDIPFSYITTVGLYNDSGELLAVAKLSRPIEKNSLHNLSIRVRLDY